MDDDPEETRFSMIDRVVAGIGGACLVVMLVLTVGSSASRFLFSAPIPDMEAIAEMLLVVVVFFGLAFTQVKRGHVEVTLFTDHLSDSARRRLMTFGSFVGLLAFGLLFYALSKGALRAYDTGDSYLGVNQIPTWPARALAAFGTAVFALRLALDVIAGLAPRRSDQATRTKVAAPERH
jgi:TRAP-type C4-dicarboxylate transport system permease small subunit